MAGARLRIERRAVRSAGLDLFLRLRIWTRVRENDLRACTPILAGWCVTVTLLLHAHVDRAAFAAA